MKCRAERVEMWITLEDKLYSIDYQWNIEQRELSCGLLTDTVNCIVCRLEIKYQAETVDMWISKDIHIVDYSRAVRVEILTE